MGWGKCGSDTRGRPIGYYHVATCDHPGCKRKIDRGLSYACGGMHGTESGSFECEGYFCGDHMRSVTLGVLHVGQQCLACNAEMIAHMRKCPEDFSAEELEDALGAEYLEKATPMHNPTPKAVKLKKVRAWCVVSPRGRILSSTAADDRRTCLIDWTSRKGYWWLRCVEEGYRCVRVTITIDAPKKRRGR